jgi:hypothetical protein
MIEESMMDWLLLQHLYADPAAQLMLLNDMLSEDDPRSAREQLNEGYAHAGGWRPSTIGFKLSNDAALLYPGDPPQHPWAATSLRNETILVYPGEWVLILQENGSFEVCMMD